jgi:hypothetical protein
MPLDGDVKQFETETKPDVFSLEGLRDWLKTQDKSTEYEYFNCEGRCLIGQYCAARGVDWRDAFLTDRIPLELRLVSVAFGRRATFGAALSRCEAAIKNRT